MDAKEQLSELWPNDLVGKITISTNLWTPNNEKHWRDVENISTIKQIDFLDVPDGRDAYFTPVSHLNGRKSDPIAIPCFWSDFDFKHEYKVGGIPDNEFVELLEKAVFMPTRMIQSGYGMQGYWIFDKGPAECDKELEIFEVQKWFIQTYVQSLFPYTLDSVWDHPRPMRLAGFYNHKYGGKKPVKKAYYNGPKLDLEEIYALYDNRERKTFQNNFSPVETTELTNEDTKPDQETHEYIKDISSRKGEFQRCFYSGLEDGEFPANYSRRAMTLANYVAWDGKRDAKFISKVLRAYYEHWDQRHSHWAVKLGKTADKAIASAKPRAAIEGSDISEALFERDVKVGRLERTTIVDNVSYRLPITLGNKTVYVLSSERGVWDTWYKARNLIRDFLTKEMHQLWIKDHDKDTWNAIRDVMFDNINDVIRISPKDEMSRLMTNFYVSTGRWVFSDWSDKDKKSSRGNTGAFIEGYDLFVDMSRFVQYCDLDEGLKFPVNRWKSRIIESGWKYEFDVVVEYTWGSYGSEYQGRKPMLKMGMEIIHEEKRKC